MNDTNNLEEKSLNEELNAVENTVDSTQNSVPVVKKDRDVDMNKEIAAMSYIWILSVPIFFLRKDSKFIQSHAVQGIHLFGLSLVAWFIATINYIWWIGVLLLFVYIFLIVKGALKAVQGEDYYVPFLTDFLSKKGGILPTEDFMEHLSEIREVDEDTEEILKKQEEEEEMAHEDIAKKVGEVLDNNEEQELKS